MPLTSALQNLHTLQQNLILGQRLRKALSVSGNAMIHRIIILVHLIITSQFIFAQNSKNAKVFHPTGTYLTHFSNENGATFPQGTIKIKLIKPNRILVNL